MSRLLYLLFPQVWFRWWSARILATVACSVWLHSGNPEFTLWQKFKRERLRIVVFLRPGPLPVRISVTKGKVSP